MRQQRHDTGRKIDTSAEENLMKHALLTRKLEGNLRT
jgi:hypothetical protein